MKKFLITVFCFISHTSFASAGVDFYFDRHPTIAHNVYTSSIIHFDHPMDRAVLSWNATTPDNSYIELYLRSRSPHGKWSNWFALGIWGQRIPSHSVKQAETKFGKVDIDTVELKVPATDWQ